MNLFFSKYSFQLTPISIDIVQLQYKDIDPLSYVENYFLLHLTRSLII